jgi:hypothetical protein
MVYNTQKHWACGHLPSFGILNNWNTTSRKLDLFPSSSEGKEAPTLFGPFEIPNLHPLKLETDPLSNILFSSYLEFWTMDKVQRPIDSLNQFWKENKYSQYFIRSINDEFISGVEKYGAEEDIWTEEGWGDGWMEKIA